MKRTDMSGIQLPPLDRFRAFMSEITGSTYPEGGKWQVFQSASIETVRKADPNGGDAEAVEEQERKRVIRDQGEWVEAEVPF